MESSPSYPLVTIHNSTSFSTSGTVSYVVCKNDDYTAAPGATWTAASRGGCLLNGISATVVTPNGNIAATPYRSAGTTYSQFAIVQTGTSPISFSVTRMVNDEESPAPANHGAPASPQK